MNPQVVNWLENGHIREAIIGDGSFFIMDHTYRSEHARSLIFNTLIAWAHQTGKQAEAANAIEDTVASVAEKDPMMVANILVFYFSDAVELKQFLPVNATHLVELFEKAMNARQGLIDSNPKIISNIRELLTKYLKVVEKAEQRKKRKTNKANPEASG